MIISLKIFNIFEFYCFIIVEIFYYSSKKISVSECAKFFDTPFFRDMLVNVDLTRGL